MNILNTYNEFNISNFDLNVDHYGAEICDGDYSFGPSIRNDYVLHFIVNGQGKFIVDDKKYYLKEGDLFLLPQNKVTFYQADRYRPWTYIWVGFSGSKAESILKETSILDKSIGHSSLESPILNQLLKLIRFADETPTRITELVLIGELYKLLGFLIQEFPSKKSLQSDQVTKTYVKEAIKLIYAKYDLPIKIQEIADKLSLNRSYLYKIFKDYTGYSIKDYILHVKLEKSKELLQDSRLSISEVANSIGYSDPLQFSKIFKKFYNKSPRAYRKDYN
ncbi:AraC family transcriptional regulator [Streptococcus parauberis]|uniref:AraC-like ligand binding domain protein n=1 Tax=Streptococcus parauberis NCFD 2020 TaxID=873447 RepID=F1YZM0_9STRE|nr:AraC family ligand binding domain-containing protein [Streptococcus parauberis]EGE54710.1 AraC-like ligand binding domain protein [Streptococcus parauberis NCFD 2020]RFE01391.1 Arabinose operon regulatory protein [Streptococcus parauberis]